MIKKFTFLFLFLAISLNITCSDKKISECPSVNNDYCLEIINTSDKNLIFSFTNAIDEVSHEIIETLAKNESKKINISKIGKIIKIKTYIDIKEAYTFLYVMSKEDPKIVISNNSFNTDHAFAKNSSK